ncbi:microtubule organization protein AKNA isoform X2 [Clinocottus analis]|uniref:microtubule organization protein AKNA isoform X2 n=1 Tax=Clinocottus analis TaxID=304258 RepID=UPI0035BECE8D
METRKNITVGAHSWTLAPVRTSPTSSVISEDVWEGEDEEQSEKDDDFVSQMNENGIIGLSDTLEDLELFASYGSNSENNPNMCSEPVTSEEADPSGHESDTPEDRCYNLSKHSSRNAPHGEDVQILSPFEDSMDSAEAQVMDCKKNGRKAWTRRDQKIKKTKHPRTTNGLAESYISKGEIEETSSLQSFSIPLLAMRPATVSDPHCPIPQSVSAPIFHHPLHFTAGGITAGPGIEAETLPEMSFTESPSESHKSHVNLKSSSHCDDVKLRASPPPAPVFSKEGVSNHYSEVNNAPLEASDKSGKPHKQPTPSPRKMRQHSSEALCSNNRFLNTAKVDSSKLKHLTASPDNDQRTPRARNNAAEMDESRKGPLSYRTPDFSKVEPRVHFPKDGYIPPKSKHPPKMMSVSPVPLYVFKSPADIGKEVLQKNTAGSPASSDSHKPPTSAPNSSVPEEFRSHQQATTLLDQLQEDYNKLLTKHAEAENTIDRLRLQAKVNLYSDPPKPGHFVQAGLNRDSSQVMMLDFPQAQRAEFSSASHPPNGHSNQQRSSSAHRSTRSPDPHVGQQLAKIIYSQADKFYQQLQTFEDLLKSKKLRPFDQMQGISQLSGGLDSLERGFLLAKDEHKVLLQRGAQISHFDSERELEGLIFQCGLCMEELKEQVQQMQIEQPTCVAPPSPPPHRMPSSVPWEGGETPTHPQSPPVPLLVDPGEAAAMEVSSASEESAEEEETLNSLYLKPLNVKQRHVEQDFTTQMDHYQSFKELPKVRDNSRREGASLSAVLRSNMQPADGEREGQSHGTEDLKVQKSLSERKDKSDHLDSPSVKQQASRSISPSHTASSQSTTLHPLHPFRSRRRLEVGKSHSSSLSSLGESTALEKRNSKLQTGSSGGLSQDGIISPETDSGFVCSESSRLTPAAASSPLHRRASVSVSVPQEGNLGNPQIGPVSVPSPASSPSHSHVAIEPRSDSRLSRDQRRRTRQGQRRRTFSCSPQRCVRQTGQTMANAGTSESGLESKCSHSVSEDRQSDQYTEATRHHRGNSLRPLRSSQAANHNGEFQELQAEVTRLRERLERCVRKKMPLSSARAVPSAEENYTQADSTPHIRSGGRWCDVKERRDRQTVDEDEEYTLRRTTRKRTPSAHRQKPQLDISTGSESSPPNPQPLVSRCTQTSNAAPDGCCSHTNTVRSRTHPRRHLGVSETAVEPDARRRSSRHQEQSEIGGDGDPAHSFCCHCYLLCGRPEPSRSTEPDSPTRISCHLCPPARAASSRYFAGAAPPALLQCMPVCPPPLVMCSSDLYVSPSHNTPSEGRGRWKMRARTRHFQSSDKQHSMHTSLNRANKAAQNMKRTSGHMERTLANGVQYQELLTQSCSYQSAHSPHRQLRLSNLRLSTSTGAKGTGRRESFQLTIESQIKGKK